MRHSYRRVTTALWSAYSFSHPCPQPHRPVCAQPAAVGAASPASLAFSSLFFLWPPLDFEEMNQYLSCKLESTYNSWAMNVQCSYNDLKRQLAVHNAYAGTYSFFMWSKTGALYGALKPQRCAPVSHSLFWKVHISHCW